MNRSYKVPFVLFVAALSACSATTGSDATTGENALGGHKDIRLSADVAAGALSNQTYGKVTINQPDADRAYCDRDPDPVRIARGAILGATVDLLSFNKYRVYSTETGLSCMIDTDLVVESGAVKELTVTTSTPKVDFTQITGDWSADLGVSGACGLTACAALPVSDATLTLNEVSPDPYFDSGAFRGWSVFTLATNGQSISGPVFRSFDFDFLLLGSPDYGRIGAIFVGSSAGYLRAAFDQTSDMAKVLSGLTSVTHLDLRFGSAAAGSSGSVAIPADALAAIAGTKRVSIHSSASYTLDLRSWETFLASHAGAEVWITPQSRIDGQNGKLLNTNEVCQSALRDVLFFGPPVESAHGGGQRVCP